LPRGNSLALLPLVLGLVIFATANAAHADALDCERVKCAAVLPGAQSFKAVNGSAFVSGHDATGKIVGWVVRSTDVVDVKAYSGHPLVTLIGIDKNARLTGARLIKHSEPILLTGIPEKTLHDFVAFYPGKNATDRIAVGGDSDNPLSVDIISGATVTCLAQNQTILKAARKVAVKVGALGISALNPGRFVNSPATLTWQQMVDAKIFGHLVVREAEMGIKDASGNFVDLLFTIADAPQVGRALMGPGTYKHLFAQLKPGQHLFVILGNGSESFKGSAFVRGAIFDRVRVTQGLREVLFRDTDYTALSTVPAAGAPSFKEGAIFISRGAQIDPGAAFELVFLASRYDSRGAFSRKFKQFKSTLRLPSSVYKLDKRDLDEPLWKGIWRKRRNGIVFLCGFFLFVIGIFAGRRWTTAKPERIKRLHITVMLISTFVLGIYMQAQPSVTQLFTLIDSVLHKWHWELFALAPYVFFSWIFIAIVSVIWGRGVFCGWVCPYGAASELLNKLAIKLRVPQVSLPNGLQYLRYLILVALVALFLYSPIAGERWAEVEPFKTSFFIRPWAREWLYLGWFLVLGVLAIFTWRPFCRYLCPLGAGLALFGSFRLSGPRRRKFCSSCTICTKECEPEAIRPDGTINARECLSCMDCEATYRNEERCPPLVGIERLKRKSDLDDHGRKKLKILEEQKQDV